ncbi:hypothetical protein IWX76_000639 [Pedobacter sp. CAN_A7]|uniref:rubredoxin n=1 Tax=Pedobacter sp. CAN_A7 TaxID=2787722 RepID=UPI0018CB4209
MENGTFKNQYIKVNLPGGIVSVGDLSLILEILESAGVKHVRFGTRQQLYFAVEDNQMEAIAHGFSSSEIEYDTQMEENPNIVSSYVAEDLFSSANWLREGVYKDILDTFNYTPALKIDLVDDSQTLLPFFSGNLNFISSSIGNYWHLYIRFPKTNILYCWSSLVYSEDIARLSEALESLILSEQNEKKQTLMDGLQLETLVKTRYGFLHQAPEAILKLPEFQLPYYEGFNQYDNKYWLGIYRRNEQFSVSFLKDLCQACSKSRIGQIYTTPWKSIIIKGLEAEDRKLWNALLDKHLINVCHASNELNWQTEDLCEEGLALKLELIRAFNDADLRTYKLCFAIKITPKSGLSGSVVIRKRDLVDNESQEMLFDVLHTTDFNPNSRQYHVVAESLSRENLVPALVNLCQAYYQQQTLAAGVTTAPTFETHNDAEPLVIYVQQCPNCLSLYDESWGMASCSICETPLEEFTAVNSESLYR